MAYLDWFLAGSGLGALLLAVLEFSRPGAASETERRRRSVAAFGLLQCARAWLHLLPAAGALAASREPVEAALLALSYVALYRAASRFRDERERSLRGLRDHSPFALAGALAAGLGAALGCTHATAMARLAVGVPAGLLLATSIRAPLPGASADTRLAYRGAHALFALQAAVMGPVQAVLTRHAEGGIPSTSAAGAILVLEALHGLGFYLCLTALWLREGREQAAPTAGARGARHAVPVLLALVLALGWVSSREREHAVRERHRDRVLRQATAIAATIDPEVTRLLTFTPADTLEPAYRQIRRQMIEYGRFAGLPSIWSVVQRNGVFLFGPENLAVTDTLSSVPGTVYEQPAEELTAVYRGGRAAVIGPYTDEYGSFISGFAPVIDPASGEVLLLIGIDEFAGRATAATDAARRTAIAATIGLALALALGLGVIRRQWSSAPGSAPPQRRHAETAVTALICLGSTLALALTTVDIEQDRARHDFEQIAGSHAHAITIQARELEHDLRAMVRHLEFQDEPTASEFADFAASLGLSSPAHSWIWVPTDGPFLDPAPTATTPGRPCEHGVLIAPDSRAAALADPCLASEPRVAAAARATLATGLPAATEILSMPATNGVAQDGFLLLRPVRTSGGAHSRGLIAAVTYLHAVTARTTVAGGPDAMLATDVVDLSAPTAPPPLATPEQGLVGWSFGRRAAVHSLRPTFVGGRTIALVSRPTEAFHRAHQPVATVLVTVAALLMSALIIALVKFLADHRSRLEREVSARTAELQQSQEQAIRLYQEHQATQALFSRAFHDNPALMAISSADGRFLDVNEAWTRTTGYTRDEAIGRTPTELGIFASEDDHAVQLGRLFREGALHDSEASIRTHSGEIRHGIFGASIIQHSRDPLLLTTMVDITDREAAESALRENEERLNLVLRGTGVGLWDWNMTTGEVTVDQQWAEIFGHDFAALFSVTAGQWQTLVHPADRARVEERLQRHLDGLDVQYEDEFRMSHRDGSWIWVQARGRVVARDDAGRPLRMAGTHLEISARRLAEEQLQRTNAQLTSLLDSIPDLVFLKDREGVYLGCNPAFGGFVGRPREEILGRTDFDLFDRGVAEFFREQDRIMLENGEPRSNEEWVTYPDGQRVLLETLKAPLRTESGEILGLVGVARNATARKEAEERLAEANRRLEGALQRTQDLAEEARVANEAKSEFLAKMSHEIRTPMNGVIGMTGLLLDTDLDPDQRRFAEVIRSSGANLLELINDILDFSKIEARKLDLEVLEFDLRSVVEEAAEILSVRAAEKGLDLSTLIAPEVPERLMGDPGRLRQILVNLTGNAVKFTDSGSVSLHAALAEVDEERVRLRFEVRDTGIGISHDAAGRLFSAFTQVDNSATRKFGGTGLGLAISRQLVELMGGQIGVTSEGGQGSLFWFTADLARADATSPPQEGPDLRGINVLLADRPGPGRDAIVAILRAGGCRLQVAESGSEALDLLRGARTSGHAPEVAILDEELEDGGVETARAIRSLSEISDTGLVLLAGLGRRLRPGGRRPREFAATLARPVREHLLRQAVAIAAGRMAPDPVEEEQRATTSGGPAAARRGRILLAEDNRTNQTVALAMLERLGLRAEVVSNGLEAVLALREAPYDLVLMDVQMPEMDGLEATRAIRAPESGALNPEVPIIAMTANALSGDRDICVAAGMNDYVSKPVRPDDLAAAIDRWLPGASIEESGSADEGEETRREATGTNTVSAPASTAAEPVTLRELEPLEENSGIRDRQELLTRVGGDPELAAVVSQAFLEDIPSRMTELLNLLRGESPADGLLLAHAIKGASANVAATELTEITARIEGLLRQGNTADACDLADRLEAAAEALFALMRADRWDRAA